MNEEQKRAQMITNAVMMFMNVERLEKAGQFTKANRRMAELREIKSLMTPLEIAEYVKRIER